MYGLSTRHRPILCPQGAEIYIDQVRDRYHTRYRVLWSVQSHRAWFFYYIRSSVHELDWRVINSDTLVPKYDPLVRILHLFLDALFRFTPTNFQTISLLSTPMAGCRTSERQEIPPRALPSAKVGPYRRPVSRSDCVEPYPFSYATYFLLQLTIAGFCII